MICSSQRTLDGLHAHIANPARAILCPEPITVGPGLILRRASASDRDALASFNGLIHGEPILYGGHIKSCFDTLPDNAVHPTLNPGCFTVVVDIAYTPHSLDEASNKQNEPLMTTDGLIVATMMSIPQVWQYGETDPFSAHTVPRIPLLAIRPEAIGTHPDYRSKKLAERQLQVHQEWAQALGVDVSFLVGVEGFYRRFGYELAPACMGGRGGFLATVPKHVEKNGEKATEPYVIRLAVLEDAQFITRVDRVSTARRRHLACDLDEAWWRNSIAGKLVEGAFNKRDVFIIEASAEKNAAAPEDARVGFFQLSTVLRVVRYEIDPTASGHSWSTITPSLLRFLAIHSLSLIQKKDQTQTSLPQDWTFGLNLSPSHPCFSAVASDVHLPKIIPEYRMYTKIMDLPKFLERIARVLTYRLKRSITWNSYTGDLALVVNHSNVSAKGGTVIKIMDGSVVSVSPAPERVTLDELVEQGWNAYGVGGGTFFVLMIMGMANASTILE
ncbi:hypothetical protein HDU67_000724, partial [Dinochytrium kinnereticum]